MDTTVCPLAHVSKLEWNTHFFDTFLLLNLIFEKYEISLICNDVYAKQPKNKESNKDEDKWKYWETNVKQVLTEGRWFESSVLNVQQ